MKTIALIFLLFSFSCNEKIVYSPETSAYPEINEYKDGIIYDLSFPKMVYGGDSLLLVEMDKEEQDYYLEIEEKNLSKEIPGNTIEYYRFTLLPSICEELVVASISRERGGRILYSYKRYNSVKREIVERISHELSNAGWEEFITMINRVDLWSLTNNRYWEAIPFDGETWMLEGFKTKEDHQAMGAIRECEYIEVKRHSINLHNGCFWEVCKYMESLSGSKFVKNGCIWE